MVKTPLQIRIRRVESQGWGLLGKNGFPAFLNTGGRHAERWSEDTLSQDVASNFPACGRMQLITHRTSDQCSFSDAYHCTHTHRPLPPQVDVRIVFITRNQITEEFLSVCWTRKNSILDLHKEQTSEQGGESLHTQFNRYPENVLLLDSEGGSLRGFFV